MAWGKAEMTGLYIHVPFCIRKCAYCDFYSLTGQAHLIDGYVEAVLTEARARPGLSFDTLYLGGGTPSLLGARGLTALLAGLRSAFDLSGMVEATIEVNPESADADLLQAALEFGLNRISVGVQSLQDEELRRSGRVHNASQALAAVEQAREAGFGNVSVDVIVGLPGQSWLAVHSTLNGLATLGVDHLSLYCLSVENGTALALNPPPDLPSGDEQAELFEDARSFLESLGYLHYEISNFALPGRACLHNLNYWRGGEYLGLGPAAASHLSGRRFRNRADLEAYRCHPGGLVEEVEELGPEDKAAEEAMLRLRLLSEGLVADGLVGRYGCDVAAGLLRRLDDMVSEGLLRREGSRYCLEPSRLLTSNPVFARVLG
jgi:oxygen-independent coproporphyrinogen-3 oxidase